MEPTKRNEKFRAKPNESKTKKEAIIQLLKEVLYNSLAQSIIKITFSPHIALKLFLLTFVLVTIGLASYLVIEAFIEYFAYGVSTTSRTFYENPTLFPKITFCNINPRQTQYAYNSCLKGKCEPNRFTDKEKKWLSHDLNEILSYCVFNNRPCNASDFTWSFDDLYGNCYTFNSGFDSNGNKVDLKKSSITGFGFGLTLIFYVNYYEKLMGFKNQGLGAVIRIGNSSYLTDYSLGGLFVSPGNMFFLSVEREFKSMLPKPYSDCEIDSSTPKYKHGSDLYNIIAQSTYTYTQQFCFYQCIQKKAIDQFNCTVPSLPSLFNVSKCPASLSQFTMRMDSILSENFINEICLPLCPLECNQNLYKTSISSFEYYGIKTIMDFHQIILNNSNLASDFINRTLNTMTASESFVCLNIFYDSLSYIRTSESPKMNVVALLASIGGNLGLFLGVSVFSLCELVEVFIEMLYIFYGKNKIYS